jgi:tetratricopeptide (TPR) repeat protein
LNFARLRGGAAERGLGLVAIATAYDDHARVNAPLLDESERIARGVEDVERRSQVLDVVSGAWILARNLAHARRVAQDIHDPAIRALAVARVGLALASTSQDARPTLEEAVEIADGMSDLKRRNETLVDIAATVLEAGDLPLSRIVARKLPDAEHALMLQRVVVRFANADEATLADTVAEALAVIAKLAHAEDQAAAYASLGLALAETGRTANAVEVLAAARSAAHAIATTDYYDAVNAVASVAMVMVPQDGFFIQAAWVLDRVGHALMQAGRVDDAEAVFADARHELAGVADVEQRDAVLARIGTRPIADDARTESDTLNVGPERDALALARAGKLTEATAVLEESVRAREGALAARDGAARTLVASFAELGDLPTALALS